MAAAARRSPVPAPIRNLARGLAVPVGSVLFAFVAGGIIVLVTGANPLDAYQALLCGGVGLACTQGENSALQLANSVVYTIPLIMTGAAVALPFRAGLFNIGAEGQFVVGTLACTAIGARFSDWPAIVLIPTVLIAGTLAGAAWAGIAGVLKATTGAHEVVTTIMLNYIAQWLLRFMIIGGPLQPPGVFSASAPIGQNARLTTFLPNSNTVMVFGLPASVYRVHTGIIVALIAIAIFAVVLWRTSLGYEIRALGQSQKAARYAGVSVRRTIIVTMLIAGAFSGLAGAVQIAGVDHGLTDKYFSDTTGFDAIAVALLGLGSAVGIVLAALLFGALHSGGAVMQSDAGLSSSLVLVLQALILFSIAANFLGAILRQIPSLRARPSAPAPTAPGTALVTEAATAPPGESAAPT